MLTDYISSIPRFENPLSLWLLLALVPYIVWYFLWGNKSKPSIQMSSLAGLVNASKGIRYFLQHVPFVLRCLALVLLIIAFARPRSSKELERVDVEGIDIMITLDVSTSMLARDFKPDRLSAAKDIAIEFVSKRLTDRIGITVFAGESFVQCPLTTDKTALINLIASVEAGLIEDGTAIGNGLATSVSRLKDSDAKSKVVILLTDGDNNRGQVAPITAAEIAKLHNIRVYTIGIGANGTAPYPVQTFGGGVQMMQVPVVIDEPLLKEIAQLTKGEYFRATDNTKLKEIYAQIDEMEKTKSLIDAFPVYKEEFMPYLLAGLALLMLELLLRMFVLRRLP